jgi:hypothetical protein
MKLEIKEEPRIFNGAGNVISDYGKIMLEAGEMVSFVTKTGKECDFTAMPWGFYVGPSLNSRLKNQGFKTALVLNEKKQIFVLAVEEDRIDEFKSYLKTNQNMNILTWLDEWVKE